MRRLPVDIEPRRYGPSGPASRALVLLPGLGAQESIWAPTLRRIPEATGGVDVLFGPAVGQATAGRPELRPLPALGEATAERVARLPHPHVVVAGHSLGAFLAVEVASRLPGRLEAVVLVNAGLSTATQILERPLRTAVGHPVVTAATLALVLGVCLPAPPGLRRALSRDDRLAGLLLGPFAGKDVAADADRRDALVQALGHPEIAEGLLANRHLWRRFVETAPRVDTDVELVAGGSDPISPLRAVEDVARWFRRATVICVAHGRHALPLEAPGVVASVLTAAWRGRAGEDRGATTAR